MAEKGCGGQFVGGANGCEMVDVDQKADSKELDASGSSGSGGVAALPSSHFLLPPRQGWTGGVGQCGVRSGACSQGAAWAGR